MPQMMQVHAIVANVAGAQDAKGRHRLPKEGKNDVTPAEVQKVMKFMAPEIAKMMTLGVIHGET